MKWRAMILVDCKQAPPSVIGECYDWTHKPEDEWTDHITLFDSKDWNDGTIAVGVEYDED